MILYVYYILWNYFMSIEIWGTWDWRKTYLFWEMFFEIQKKNVNNNFYEKWGKILFFGRILKREKKWCRLMVKAFLLLSRKNGAIRTWHSYSMMKIQWYCILIKYYLPCQSIQVIIYGHLKKKLWMIRHLYYTIVV